MEYEILTTTSLTPDWQKQIRGLFRQLNPDLPQLDTEMLLKGVNPPTIMICRNGERILGMGTLCTYRVISGHKAWIEDVVVEGESRGSGIGRELMKRLISHAREQGVGEVLLFTGHHRAPALGLYRSLGFEEKQSKLLRLTLNRVRREI